jgi:hypothetical protein
MPQFFNFYALVVESVGITGQDMFSRKNINAFQLRQEIAAAFDIEITERKFEVTIRSAGGGKNPEYKKLLVVVLERAAAAGAQLELVLLASTGKTANTLTQSQRIMQLPDAEYPLDLKSFSASELAEAICLKMSSMARRKTLKHPEKGGNRRKRITLSFLMNGDQFDDAEIARFIQYGSSHEELKRIEERGVRVRSRIDLEAVEALLAAYAAKTPEQLERAVKYVERGPIGRIAKEITDYKCQLCAPSLPPAFVGKNGKPYVEAHHVEAVAGLRQSTLGLHNILVLCANHHRQLHYGRSCEVSDSGAHFELVLDGEAYRIAKLKFEKIDG